MFRSCENFISLAAACEKPSVSAALSLKTSHCDVFLTLAFAPRYLLLDCRMKHGQSKKELSVFLGGDNGARTRDLLTASQALSQLSYTPMRIYSVLFKPRRSFDCGASGGDKGIRTPDLLNANQALSQLSYTPRRRIYYSIQFLIWQVFYSNFFILFFAQNGKYI